VDQTTYIKRHVILSAPARAKILRVSLGTMCNVGMPMPEVILGADFTTETEHERETIVTDAHLNVWREIAKRNETTAIYEDDAFFIRRHEVMPLSPTTIFFFGVIHATFSNYTPGGLSTLQFAKGVHAYVVTPSVARILLDTPQDVVDRMTCQCICDGVLEGVVPTPYACFQTSHGSNICNSRATWIERHSGMHDGRRLTHNELLRIKP
jgi:hypothetical protein